MCPRTLFILLALAGLTLAAGLLAVPGTALAQSGGASAATAASAPSESQVTPVLASPETTEDVAQSPSTVSADFAGRDPQAFLDQLRRRERELDRREQALANERATLEAVHAEIETRIAELQRVRDEMAGRLEVIDRARQQRIDALAGWCAGMEPRQAAAQLSTQPVDVIVDVLMAMDERAASAVLEQITPEKAGEVIQEMSRRN